MFKPTILIDFDETITQNRGFDSTPNEAAIAAICLLHQKYKIVIYSCRANEDAYGVDESAGIAAYLNRYNVPYDEISTDKPMFYALIDDRSINPKVTAWEDIVDDLLKRI